MTRIFGAEEGAQVPAAITAEMRINEVVGWYPPTVRILQTIGFDTCCGGGRTIAEACTQHDISTALVLEALNDAIIE